MGLLWPIYSSVPMKRTNTSCVSMPSRSPCASVNISVFAVYIFFHFTFTEECLNKMIEFLTRSIKRIPHYLLASISLLVLLIRVNSTGCRTYSHRIGQAVDLLNLLDDVLYANNLIQRWERGRKENTDSHRSIQEWWFNDAYININIFFIAFQSTSTRDGKMCAAKCIQIYDEAAAYTRIPPRKPNDKKIKVIFKLQQSSIDFCIRK